MSDPENVKSARGVVSGDRRPLYRSIADCLRRELASGKLEPGAKLPPVRDLANQFKVSVITVSKALRTLESEGRLTCIPAVGAFVPAPPEARPVPRHMTIAFATVAIEEAFTQGLAASLEAACRSRGWILQIHNARTDPSVEAEALTRLPRTGTRGAVILPISDDANIEALFRLKFNKFPFVLVDRRIEGLRVDAVESDHEQGGYLAAKHLIARGHRRVLMLTCQPGMFSSADDRVRGYERALTEAGIVPQAQWKLRLEDTQGGNADRPWGTWYQQVLPVLKNIELPTAVIALNSYAGRGLLEACRELKLRIPEDVSVVSFDATEFLEGYHPPITVVAQRIPQIGQTALGLLERRLLPDAPPDAQRVLIEMDLIERKSVRDVVAG
ncbi:MAG: substrate-binding domain-containing protein [Planctomycetes bacterium]|nr:substrate-binding domain-containing protein [Planctomycetota bacterium]